MATTKEFHDYIIENLQKCGDVFSRKMMGEYCVYYRGKLIGLICDNCFMIKQTESSVKLLDGSQTGYPYEGSKTLMIMVDDVENTELMNELLEALFEELPEKKRK